MFVLYLVAGVGCPEASGGAFVGVGWEDRPASEQLVDVLQDDERLADGLAVVDEHGHLLMHGVGRQEEVALVLEVLLDVAIAQVLEMERNPDPASPDTVPCAE